MKKFVAITLTLILVLASFTGCSLFDTSKKSEVKYKVVGDHAAVKELPTVTGLTELVIDDEYEGLPVTDIPNFTGFNLEYAEKIVIGKNVETIGEWAFTNNQKLKEFSVSEENEHFCSVDGVLFTKDMKTLVYYPCAASSTYVIPDSVEEIRSKAFYKAGNLKNLTLPSSLKSIGEKAFFRCGSLENVVLPEGIENIAKDAFGYCTALTEVTIPASIKTIGEYAFYNCTSLLNVTVGAKESEVSLGKDWQPTNNGLKIDELKVTFAE